MKRIQSEGSKTCETVGCGERSLEESLNIAEENQQLRKRIKVLEKENKRPHEMNEFLKDAAAFLAAIQKYSIVQSMNSILA